VTIVSGNVIQEISKLKQQIDGDIVIYGSGRLAHTLIQHNLIDELRAMTYPVVVGA